MKEVRGGGKRKAKLYKRHCRFTTYGIKPFGRAWNDLGMTSFQVVMSSLVLEMRREGTRSDSDKENTGQTCFTIVNNSSSRVHKDRSLLIDLTDLQAGGYEYTDLSKILKSCLNRKIWRIYSTIVLETSGLNIIMVCNSILCDLTTSWLHNDVLPASNSTEQSPSWETSSCSSSELFLAVYRRSRSWRRRRRIITEWVKTCHCFLPERNTLSSSPISLR